MTIGEKIKMQRKSLGLTQTELGAKLGVQKTPLASGNAVVLMIFRVQKSKLWHNYSVCSHLI